MRYFVLAALLAAVLTVGLAGDVSAMELPRADGEKVLTNHHHGGGWGRRGGGRGWRHGGGCYGGSYYN